MPSRFHTKQYSTFLFDLDGTLIDTAADFVVALNKLCAQYHIEAPAADIIRSTVSDGARALTQLCFSLKEGDDGFEARKQDLLKHYHESLGDEARLFDGFEQVLTQIKKQGANWGIVTNKPWEFTEPLINALFIEQDIAFDPPSSIICPDHVNQTKPDPEGIFLACQQSNADIEKTLYVGDHIRDIEAGKNANITTVACRYGYIKNDDCIDTWHADLIIDSPLELIPLIADVN